MSDQKGKNSKTFKTSRNLFGKFTSFFDSSKKGDASKTNDTKEEVQDVDEIALRDAFNKFDANGDGVIDKEELAQLLKDHLKLNEAPTPVQLARIMAKVDLNANGKIEFHEFKIMMIERMKTKNTFLVTFKNFDLDGDGYITADELRESMKKVHSDTTEEEIEVIMKNLDLSKSLFFLLYFFRQ